MSDFNYSSSDCFSSNSNAGSSGNEADSEGEEVYDKDMNEMLNIMKTFNPYLFEPEKEVSDTDSSNESEIDKNSLKEDYAIENLRVGNIDWCKCGGKCKVEKREIDCLCCQEVHALNSKFDAENNIACITESKYFVLTKQYWKMFWLVFTRREGIILKKTPRIDRLDTLLINNLSDGCLSI